MPPTISVAAFVFGIVLLLAALIGKEIRIVTMELPALDRLRRILLGAIGLGLVLFGLADGQLPQFRQSAQPAAQSTVAPASAGAQSPPQSTIAPAPAGAQPSSPVAAGGVLPCLADVAETDLVILPMDSTRRTDRRWSTGQPRAGVLAMQFEDATGIRGGVKFQTLASAAGIDIIAVVDAACQPLTTYSNISRPDQPKDAPYNYDTMRYQFGDVVYAADVSYGEGNGKLGVRAQQSPQ